MRSLFARLLYAICGVATAALGLALFLQGRSLSEDLRTAAERRLDTAATAAQRLLDTHLLALSERYRAISGTPQFRATLEIDDGPTLAHYAQALLEQSGALRIAFLGAGDDVVAGAGDASLDAQAFAVKERGLIAHEGRPYAVASTPIADAGRLVAIEPIEAGVIAGWAELCGAEVGFAPRGAARPGVLHREPRSFDGMVMRVSQALDAEHNAVANARLNLALAAGLGLALAFGASLVVSQGLVQPIQELKAAAGRVGSGDLTTPLQSQRTDEIGEVARAFGRMTRDLGGTVGQVATAANRVEKIAADISGAADGLVQVAQAQALGTEDTAERLARLGTDVRQIADQAEGSARALDQAVDGSSASFKELAHSGQALKQSASSLSERSEEIGASIETMIESAAEVGASTEQLLSAVRVTADSMSAMETATRDVSAHAESTARLSGAVVTASEDGRRLVRSTVAGMDSIRSATDEVQKVISSLRERAGAIGRVLAVIDEVTDETALLALNAAIIAAQAGERGKAFAVVADEMKALANRVSEGAKEIDGLVSAVQQESQNAVTSIERGATSVHQAVDLARQAERSLDQIAEAARESGDRMTESARASSAQKQVASEVARQMELVRQSAERIRDAAEAQQKGNEVVRRSSGALREVAREVQTTISEQARGAERIGTSIEAVQRAVNEITRGLASQAAAHQGVADVVKGSRAHTHAHEESAARLGTAAAELAREAQTLRAAVERFKI
ncbi:MAG TPA: HAMP domain-containing methyl-accepting chemotaxis protein [Myxococcota bacterium]|nr:HAMP domain-containing methyl-accepting chemotaxis protein [Myxococcota bacterium]